MAQEQELVDQREVQGVHRSNLEATSSNIRSKSMKIWCCTGHRISHRESQAEDLQAREEPSQVEGRLAHLVHQEAGVSCSP